MKIGVVGGGIFGLAAALELCDRGHEVAIFDQGKVPYQKAASTDVSKAIRRSRYAADNATYVALVEQAARQWRVWEKRFGTTVYHQTGGLTILPSFLPGSPMYESWRFLRAHAPRDVEILSRQDVRTRFPQFKLRDDEIAFFDSWQGYLESGRAVSQLAKLAIAEGVQIHEGTPVLEVVESVGASQLVTEYGRNIFDRIVVAAGAWIGKLLPQLANHVLVTRQQMVLIEVADTDLLTPPAMPVWALDPDGDAWYGFPLLREGYVKVSNDAPGVPVDPNVGRDGTQEFVDQTIAFLQERIPVIATGRVVGNRSCLYTNSPDDHFIIDWIPGSQQVLVAGGGSGHGFKFGGSIGKVIADAVEDKDNPLGRLFRIANRFQKEGREGLRPARGFTIPQLD